MKFTSVLKQIILEQSRFEILMNKYVKPKKKGENVIAPKMKKEELYKIINADDHPASVNCRHGQWQANIALADNG